MQFQGSECRSICQQGGRDPRPGMSIRAGRMGGGDFVAVLPPKARELACAPSTSMWGLRNMIATVPTDNADGDSLDHDGPIKVLLRLAEAGRLSRSGDGSIHVRVPVGDRHEVYGIRSGALRDWLIEGYFGERGEPPAPWMIARVVGLLEARARFDGETPSVFVRVAPVGDDARGRCSFLDLGDGTGAAIKISADGWEVSERPDVQFKRPAGMLALPVPVRGGSIELLRPYVNVDDAGFRLVIAWLTSALLPVGPYPILSLHGEQGSAKSTLARILRLLIDPQACALLAEPASNRDLMVTARNGWLLAYDNITDIPGWLSDSLCRLVFGAGFSGRALYTDDERIVLQAQRPVILNGIEDFVRKSDLIDRTIIVQMRSISPKRRRHEEELWASFGADQPLILGSVLDAVAHGLRELAGVKLERMPRMADFARWGVAVGRGLGWRTNAFLSAYEKNRIAATEGSLDGSPLGTFLLTLVGRWLDFDRSPTDMLEMFTRDVDKKVARSAGWPKNAQAFTGELRRIAPQLLMRGVVVIFRRTHKGRRIRIVTKRYRACAEGALDGDASEQRSD